LKFTEKGFIEYGYTPVVIDNISLLEFYVKDSGIGIAKEKQEYIFDIFRQGDDTYTKRYDGVGIGLSVSKKLTELLGGQMWINSETGVGSCFYFTIPYVF
jgi:signal transduction histidine kinase